jgi:hypothetical protein
MTNHMINDKQAERFTKMHSKYGHRYHTWHWRVQDGNEWRQATSAEARALNRQYGHTPGYAGPNHPSYRPY